MQSILALNTLLNEASPRAQRPAGAQVVMKPHQLALLQQCQVLERGHVPDSMMGYGADGQSHSIHAMSLDGQPSRVSMRTQMGIIADRAGAGKSFVVLSLVLASRDEPVAELDPTVISVVKGKITLYAPQPARTTLKLTVLVIPHTIFSQWQEYTQRFAPDMNVYFVNRRKHIEKLRIPGFLATCDLLVVTSTFYHDVALRLMHLQARVRRVVFDEADNLAFTSTLMVDTMFTWFVTASYGNLLFPRGVSSMEYYRDPTARQLQGVRSCTLLRALFAELQQRRGVCRAIMIKSDDAFVARSMELPDPVVHRIICRTPGNLRMLHGVVDRSIIECLNAGDVAGAIQHVNPDNRGATEDHLLIMLMDRYQRQVRTLDARIALVPTLEHDSVAERTHELQRLTTKRDEIVRNMDCIRDRIASTDTCCICCDAIQNKAIVRCCSNAFCFGCISRWTTRTASCPLCKAEVRTQDLLVLDDSVVAAPAAPADQTRSNVNAAPGSSSPTFASDLSTRRLDKLRALEAIVQARRAESPGKPSKFLIFSSNDNTFLEVANVLSSERLKHAQLKGNGACVANTVTSYKSGDLDALLVNTTHYGNGLNLENTTDVILFHKFDSEVEHQVLGRALRMGRTEALQVWYLLYDHEAREA